MKSIAVFLCTLLICSFLEGCNENNTMTSTSSTNSSSLVTNECLPIPTGYDVVELFSYEEIIEYSKLASETYNNIKKYLPTEGRSEILKMSLHFSKYFNLFVVPLFNKGCDITLQKITLCLGDTGVNSDYSFANKYDGVTYSFISKLGTLNIDCQLAKGDSETLYGQEVYYNNLKSDIILQDYTLTVVKQKQNHIELIGSDGLRRLYCTIKSDTNAEALLEEFRQAELLMLGEYLYSLEATRMALFDNFGYVKLLASCSTETELEQFTQAFPCDSWFKNHDDVVKWLERWQNAIFLISGDKRPTEDSEFNCIVFHEKPDTDILEFRRGDIRFLSYHGALSDVPDAEILSTFEHEGYTCTVYDTKYKDFIMKNGDSVILGHSTEFNTEISEIIEQIKELKAYTFSELLDE